MPANQPICCDNTDEDEKCLKKSFLVGTPAGMAVGLTTLSAPLGSVCLGFMVGSCLLAPAAGLATYGIFKGAQCAVSACRDTANQERDNIRNDAPPKSYMSIQ